MNFATIGRFASFYIQAKQVVISSGFIEDILLQEAACLDDLTESSFLQELAWVVLCSGMSEKTIRKKFPALCESFLNFRCSAAIIASADECVRKALSIYAHQGKITAIVEGAREVASYGFFNIKQELASDPFTVLRKFKYVGPITVKHLAKNIGVVTAKEDRHLRRLAAWAGFNDANELCAAVSNYTGERPDLVDTVLWRYATLHGSRNMPSFEA